MGKHNKWKSKPKKKYYYSNKSWFTKTYYSFERFSRNHPIVAVGLSLLAALVLFRLALFDLSLRPYTTMSELQFWLVIIGVIMVLVSLLAVKAYWKRTVPDFHIKGTADVNWKKW